MSVGQVVSKTVDRNKVFGWNLFVDTESNCIYYYNPNGVERARLIIARS